MEKINIYVPENIGNTLENDAIMFEVYKNDGRTVNKNRFLGMLINGYYNDYVDEARLAFNQIISVIDNKNLSMNEKEDIANRIVKNVIFPNVPNRKGKNPKRISLKPTKSTEDIIVQIMRDLGGEDYISQYFCRMLMSYCDKPFSKREQIVFKDNVEMIKNACDLNKSLSFKTIWNKNDIHYVIPYKLVTGPEEMFNYLLCSEVNTITGTQEAKTYRLNRLDRVHYGSIMSSISDSVKKYLDMMIEYGPQYIINDEELSCIRLSDSGVRNYSRIYYGRPIVDRIEEREDGHYYYFKGSKDQIFFYFRRFGFEDAEIVYPEQLRRKMMEFHSKACEMYKGGINNG